MYFNPLSFQFQLFCYNFYTFFLIDQKVGKLGKVGKQSFQEIRQQYQILRQPLSQIVSFPAWFGRIF